MIAKATAAAAILALQLYVYHFAGGSFVIPPRQGLDGFPLELGSFRCPEPEELPDEIEDQLGLTDYLVCDYQRKDAGAAEQPVNAYIGYNEAQLREGAGSKAQSAIHPPEHCLPGAGWDIIDSRTVTVDVPGLPQRPAEVNRLVIAKGEARQLVYYWFQSRGRVIADAYQKLFYLFLDRATRSRADGALVRITVPFGPAGEEGAEETLHAFLPRFAAELPRFLPH